MGSWLINLFLRCKTEIMIETAKANQWKVLNLSHQSLKEIPGSLYSISDEPNLSSNLKSLSLDHNNIKRLPLEFITFVSKGIENLSLANNRLEGIPLTFSFSGAYKHLKFLNISDNDFSKSGFPIAICHCCCNLQYLWANGIQVKEIPKEISLLKNLRTLGLRRNKLSSLPSSIVELCDLSWLTLDQNLMEEIPIFIFQLKNLTHLNLNRNLISTLPPQWFNLKALQYLYVRDNLLEISDNLIRDIQRSPNLKCADLTGNLKVSQDPFLGCVTRKTPTRNVPLETLWKNEVTLNEVEVDVDVELLSTAGANNKKPHFNLPVHEHQMSKLGLLHVSKKNKHSPQDQGTSQSKDECTTKPTKGIESESQELTPADSSSSTHLYIELHDVGTSTSRCIPLLTKRVKPNPNPDSNQKGCQLLTAREKPIENCNLNKNSYTKDEKDADKEDEKKEKHEEEEEEEEPPQSQPQQKQLPTQTSLMAWTAAELLEGGGSESHVTRRWEIRSNIMAKAKTRGWEEEYEYEQEYEYEYGLSNEGEIYLMNSTSSVSHDEFPYLENLPRPASIILLSQNHCAKSKENELEKERRDGSGEQQKEEPEEQQRNPHLAGKAERKPPRFRRSRNSRGLLNEFRVGLRPDENSVLEWGIHGNEDDDQVEAETDDTFNTCYKYGNSTSCSCADGSVSGSGSVSDGREIYNDARPHNDHNDNENSDNDDDDDNDTVNSSTISLEESISTDDLFSFHVLSNSCKNEYDYHHQDNLNFNETQLTDLDQCEELPLDPHEN